MTKPETFVVNLALLFDSLVYVMTLTLLEPDLTYRALQWQERRENRRMPPFWKTKK